LNASAGYPKVLVWSRSAPDGPSGTPAILERCLEPIPPGRVEIVCEDDGAPQRRRKIALPHPVTRIAYPFRSLSGKLGSAVHLAARYPSVAQLVSIGLRHVRRFEPDVMLTVLYDDRWVLSSYLLSRLTGIPVIYCVHDAYAENAEVRKWPWERAFPGWIEPRALRHGTVTTILGNLARVYRQKYGIACHLIRHPAPRVPLPERRRSPGKPLRIAFAGAVYDNVIDPLRQLAGIVAADPELSLTVLSPASPEQLAGHGISGRGVEARFERQYEKLLAALAEFDLLFLPLAAAGGPELAPGALQYALPTKTVDYLLAGAPILVHCPAHFELYQFLEGHQAAHLLPTGGDETLASWLGRWKAEAVPAIPVANRQQACAEFAPATIESSWRKLFRDACRWREPRPCKEIELGHCPACQQSWRPGPALDISAQEIDEPMFTEELAATVGALRFRRCGACGSLVAVDARRSGSAFSEAYANLPHAYWSNLAAQSRLGPTIDRHLPPGEGLDLWDVGCGDGRLLASLPPRWRKHGIEPGLRAVAAAASRGYDVKAGTASGLALRQVGDVVVSVDVMEHLLDPALELRAMYEMLRPGGTIAIVTGDATSSPARLAHRSWYYLHCLGHVTVFSQIALRTLAQTVGFEAIRLTRVEHESDVGLSAWCRSYVRNKLRQLVGGQPGKIYYHRDHQLLLARRPS
jgi:SAM-dependent methyltransferase